jgi:hypothetical protein
MTVANTTTANLTTTTLSENQLTQAQIAGISAGSVIGFILVSCGVCYAVFISRKKAPAETQLSGQSVVAINDRRPSVVTADTIQRKPTIKIRIPETV